MTVDPSLVRRLRGEVADDISQQLRADELAGKARMSPADQRVFGRTLINRRPAAYAREQIESGRAPPDDVAEAELAQPIHDKLFGLGVPPPPPPHGPPQTPHPH